MLALRTCFNGIKILLTAPSDAAADVLATRLAPHCNTSQLFRLYYWQRPRNAVPTILLPYTKSYSRLQGTLGHSQADIANSYLFEMPSLHELAGFDIVVSTCGLAGALAQFDTADYKVKFDVVMVDEAANALEAEVLVPISLSKSNGCVVLAGDPMQLAASVRSPLTSRFQLFSSILERLLRGSIYRDVSVSMNTKNLSLPIMEAAVDAHDSKIKLGDNNNGVFLTKNYRSNAAIIGLSSKIFYHSSLRPMGDPAVIDSLVDCKVLQNKNFPCMFVGVEGLHERDDIDSPSFYNINELLKIRQLISTMVHDSKQVQAKEVGVICAFRSQVLRMRVVLRETGLSDVNVGSIEDYQGQENRVIIISTVLSSRVIPFEDHEGNHALIGDFRRFNVAITRAIALCIVVGNPYHLHADKRCWYQFLKYCHENDSLVDCPSGLFQTPGTSIENKTPSSVDISSILEKLNLYCIEESETDTNSAKHSKFANTDLQWRVML